MPCGFQNPDLESNLLMSFNLTHENPRSLSPILNKMNNLIKLSSLNTLRSLPHSHSPPATLRALTTWASLIHNHSHSPSSPLVLCACGNPCSHRNNAPPFNWGIRIVLEPMVVVIERYGKFHRTLQDGLHFLNPFIDRIALEYSLKGEVLPVSRQRVLTQDNVLTKASGDFHLEVVDPGTISQRSFVEAFHLAQLIMCTEMANVTFKNAYNYRDLLNKKIMEAFNLSAPQGLKCTRCCIKKILLPERQSITGQQIASAEEAQVLVYECASFIEDVQGLIDLDSASSGAKVGHLVSKCTSLIKDLQGIIHLDNARREELASRCSMTGQQSKTIFESASRVDVEHLASEFERVIEVLQDRLDLESGKREKVRHLLSDITRLIKGM